MGRMIRSGGVLVLFLLALRAAAADETITLPLRFHLTEGMVINIKGLSLANWVQPADIAGPVINEVNRIWRPAGIQFVIEQVVTERILRPVDYESILSYVANARRDENGQGDPARIRKLMQLVDPAHASPSIHNIYLMPYIGGTSQGNAQFRLQGIFVGTWTDKASRGLKPPVKTLLAEPEPFKVGSLGRTIAHEIGHTLGLPHPPAPTIRQLMTGAGYVLTAEEIATARASAARIRASQGAPAQAARP